MIYLDSAATSLHRPPQVVRAVREAMRLAGGAGRSGHSASMKAAELIFACRETAASYFKVSDPERIVFTSNCTHALNIAIRGLVKPGGHVVISGFEHNSVTRPLNSLGASRGVSITTLSTPLFEPEMALHLFEEALQRDVSLVVCTHVSNAFGYELPVGRIFELCRQRGIPMIIDAAQSAGCLPIEGDCGAVWCMPGHKGLMGPQGTGILIVPKGVEMRAFIEGGTGSHSLSPSMPDFLPDRFEAGTLNAHGIAGLKEGIEYISGLKELLVKERALLKVAADGISDIPGVRVYAAQHFFCQSGVMSFSVRGVNPERVASLLAEKGVCVRGGLHCSPSAHKSADTYPEGTVRLSVSPMTRMQEVREFGEITRKICKHIENLER